MEFYYAKLNYIKGLFAGDGIATPDLILRALTQKQSVFFRGNPYIFIDVQQLKKGNRLFLYGKLVKYGDREEPTIDKKSQTAINIVIEDKIIAQTHFVIEFKENVMYYSEVKNHINKISFIDRFNSLVEMGAANTGYEILAYPIHENYAFYKSLEKLKTILQLELKIVPTNPDPTDIIRSLDSILKKQNVAEKTLKYKAKEGGLKMDDEIKQNTVYTDVGYGRGKAIGINQNGEKVIITSVKSERQKKTPVIDPGDNSPDYIVKKIQELLDSQKSEHK